MAALEENIFTMERGTRAEGKPVGFRRFSRRDARASRKPEARRIPTPVIRPISVGMIFTTVFKPSKAPVTKTEADDVEKEEWDHQIRKKKQDTHTKLREGLFFVNVCGKGIGKYRKRDRK